jgi:uncharacterized protein (DUF1800 family)
MQGFASVGNRCNFGLGGGLEQATGESAMTQRLGVQIGNAVVVGTLCAVMAAPPAMLAQAIPTEAHLTALTPQQKTLHALNRLTFGPRPGDEAAVSKMGLEAWFQMQLHPEKIDDAAFEAQLAKFPAMQLTQQQLMARFPGPQELKQLAGRRGGGMGMETGNAAATGDPAQRAILADAVYNYQVQRKKIEAGQAATAPGQSGDQMVVPAPAPAHDDEAMMNGAPADAKAKGKKSVEKMDPADVEVVLLLSPEKRMARLLAMSPQEMLSFRDSLKPYEKLELMQGLTPAQMEVVAAMQGPTRVVGAEVLETRLLRDAESQRQLQAVMTDFWLNHFSVYVKKNQNEVYYLPSYQRDTILPNALGNFEQLLVATAESPAMLMYLDNWQSIGPDSPAASRVKKVQQNNPNGKIAKALPQGINENYARELMELHTLGVGGGYTQADVIAVAKCFTGWTIDKPYAGIGRGQQMDMGTPGSFVFMPQRHEGGDKVVLGHTIHDDGMNEGLEVLHILATNPNTAKFISTKLAVRFVSDTPAPALVDKMAATFLKTNGDIKAVLTTMFHAPEFWAPDVYRAKVKTPLEFMVSALRASDATVNNPLQLVQAMDRLGMPIYGMQTPNGYSWKQDEWVSSNALVSRMNFALVLSGDRVPGVRTDWPSLLGGDSATALTPSDATEKRLEMVVLGQAASDRTRQTVLAQFNNPTAQKQAEDAFNAQKAASMDDDGAAVGAGMLQRAAYGKKGGKGGDGGFQPGPETPLDTMAGLLLGSPEFQRR